MVLGVQWLGTLDPILWDFAKHTMCFTRDSKRITWRGVDATPAISSTSLAGHDGELLDALVDEFGPLFAEPQGLPLQFHLSHRIRLKPGTSVVVVRPY